MDKKIVGMLGALTALAPIGAQAATAPAADPLQAKSFSELLQPIPNAEATLRAMDEGRPVAEENGVQLAQYFRYHHHHHHHHFYHHHHHHHHHWRWGRPMPFFRFRHHHHHHHHHWRYYED